MRNVGNSMREKRKSKYEFGEAKVRKLRRLENILRILKLKLKFLKTEKKT